MLLPQDFFCRCNISIDPEYRLNLKEITIGLRDEWFHGGGDHPAASSDVDCSLLLVSSEDPHMDLSSQEIGNCLWYPGKEL